MNNTRSDFLSSMITRKQAAIADQLSSLNVTGLTLVATGATGAVAKLARAVVFDHTMQDTLDQFQRSGCRNVRAMATYVNARTGQFLDGKNLPTCPMGKWAFFSYASTLVAWSESSTNEKTAARRQAVARECCALIHQAEALATAEQVATAEALAQAEELATAEQVATAEALATAEQVA